MRSINTTRNIGLDVIRCIALLCVISVHFFLNSGFYDEVVTGFSMYTMVLIRNSFMICVPLFMLLTGYLIRNTDISRKYFFKIERVLSIYILSSIACAIYKMCQKDSFSAVLRSFLGAVIGLFSFETAPYSWYIEMYFGLFLLIPFLNIAYSGLQTQKEKKCLIAVLLFLTALPSVVNIFCLAGIHWWLFPSSADNYYNIIPQWWTDIYPITYFYIGRYLREYPLKLQPKTKLLLLILSGGVAGTFNFYRSYGSTFIWGPWQDYGSLFILIQATLLFSLFADLDYSHFSPFFCRILAVISDVSLGAYLVSWIFDQAFYPVLTGSISSMTSRLPWFLVIVPAVFVCSVSLSWILNQVYLFCKKYVLQKIAKMQIS